MKLTLSEVYGLVRGLPRLTDKELPIKISFRLLKLLKSCSGEIETLEKSRIKLVKKYAEEGSEDKQEFKVADEKKNEFQEEFNILLGEEVEIDFEPIGIEELGEISLATNDLISLQKIIKEK